MHESNIYESESVPHGCACVERVRHSALLCTWENTERSSNSGVRKTARRSPLCCALEFGLFSKSLTTTLGRIRNTSNGLKVTLMFPPSNFQGTYFYSKEVKGLYLSSARPFTWSRLPSNFVPMQNASDAVHHCMQTAGRGRPQSHLHLQNLRNALRYSVQSNSVRGALFHTDIILLPLFAF